MEMKTGYRVILINKQEIEAADLDMLRDYASAGAITPDSPIYDNATGKMFPAKEHPFLEGYFYSFSPSEREESPRQSELSTLAPPTHIGNFVVPSHPVPLNQHPIFCNKCHVPNYKENTYCTHCSTVFPSSEGGMVYCINPDCKCALMPNQQICIRCQQGQNPPMQHWLSEQYHYQEIWKRAQAENPTWYVCYCALCARNTAEIKNAGKTLTFRLKEIKMACGDAETRIREIRQNVRTRNAAIGHNNYGRGTVAGILRGIEGQVHYDNLRQGQSEEAQIQHALRVMQEEILMIEYAKMQLETRF